MQFRDGWRAFAAFPPPKGQRVNARLVTHLADCHTGAFRLRLYPEDARFNGFGAQIGKLDHAEAGNTLMYNSATQMSEAVAHTNLYDARMTDSYQQHVSAYLQRVIDERGLTQAELAQLCNVTQATIQRALSVHYPYKFKLQTLAEIAKSTGISLPPQLFEGDGPAAKVLPRAITAEFVSRFLRLLVAELAGDDFAATHAVRIARTGEIIAHQANAIAEMATEEERLNLLDLSLRGAAESILAFAPSPAYDAVRLQAGARLFLTWWRALGPKAE